MSLVEDSAVQSTALQWLNDPNLPLGTTTRQSFNKQVPVSDRNAYRGATVIDSNGHLSAGGLNPKAIVGVSLSNTGMGTATWATDSPDVGIQHPVLTGMIRFGDIPNAHFIINAHVDPLLFGSGDYKLQDLGPLGLTYLNIDPGAAQGATSNDWVAFSVNVGKIGRRQAPILTGPDGSSTSDSNQSVFYELTGLSSGGAIISPRTSIKLPDYTLPSPMRVSPSGLAFKLTGGVEVPSGGSGKVTVELRSVNTFVDRTLSIDIHPINTAGAWAGLLVPYSDVVTLSIDGSGNVVGPIGSSDLPVAQIYQYRSGYRSGKIRVP